jgi:hypothetical protein
MWDALRHEEQCLMVNAREHDLLPSVMWDWRTDLDFQDRLLRYEEWAEVLLRLVDDGLIDVRFRCLGVPAPAVVDLTADVGDRVTGFVERHPRVRS